MLMVGGDPTWWRRKGESLEQGSGLVKTGDRDYCTRGGLAFAGSAELPHSSRESPGWAELQVDGQHVGFCLVHE